MAGTIIAEDGWDSGVRQEIGNFLIDAVKQDREIIDLDFIQHDETSESESQIISRFGAISDKLINARRK